MMTRVDSDRPGQSHIDELQKLIEEARNDPFKLDLDQEIFPLKDRIRSLNRNIFAHLQLANISDENIQLWVKFDINEQGGGDIPLKSSDTEESLGLDSHAGPDEFNIGVQILTGHITESQSEEIAEKLNSMFKIRVTDHSTGQIFIGTISTYWITGFDYDIIGFDLEEFTEIDDQGETKQKHFPLKLPNTSEVTQNLGITFESVKAPAEIEVPLHQQT